MHSDWFKEVMWLFLKKQIFIISSKLQVDIEHNYNPYLYLCVWLSYTYAWAN